MNRIEPQIVAVIAHQLHVPAEQVTPDASLGRDLGADSLDLIEVIMTLEEIFSLEIPDEDAERIVTVDDVIRYVTNALGASGRTGHDSADHRRIR